MEKKSSKELDDLKNEESEQVVPSLENDVLTLELEEKKTLLLEKEKELAEATNSMLRIQAEFDNYRKRMKREKEEWFQYASMGIVENLLPVLDNLDIAIDSFDEQNEEISNIFSGLQMIAKQFEEILQKEGLTPIEAVGTDFDPFLHDAVMQVAVEEGVIDNQVVEEVRKGYLFKDKVLRVSMVKVAKSE